MGIQLPTIEYNKARGNIILLALQDSILISPASWCRLKG
jgi:hypothetical protein